jgi:UDP-N-acetyl-D-glucosamine dehydrogenase
VDGVIVVRNAEVAEAAKLLENIFRAVNIALVNEMKVSLESMGIDVWEVVRAASTKPFGFMPFWPGPGMGGHCIPIDPFYFAWKARESGSPARFIELAGEVNTEMPRHVVARARGALAARGMELKGARVLVLGVAYKADIDDVRESPSFEIIALLREAGARVEYSDPHVPATWAGRRHDLKMKSVELNERAVAGFDAVIMCTAHRAFDYAMIARSARLVVDTRDAMRGFEGEMGERLVRA